MAIQALKTYDLDDVNCVVGPVADVAQVNTDGYSSDGGVTFDVSSDYTEITHGADGLPIAVRNHDNLVTATIAVSQMSLTARRLDELREAQEAQSPIQPCPFFMVNPLNGDTIRDRWGVFLNKPAPSQEAEPGSREFNIALPNGREQIQLSRNIQV